MSHEKQHNTFLAGNVCSRCGQARVLLNAWQETVVTPHSKSVLTHEQYVCPDAECQKEVEASLAAKKKISDERNAAIKLRQDERNASRTLKAKENRKQV